MSAQISVILCTHNPRREFLDATLAGLREQTLSMNDWEFLLIDNKSDSPLAETVDLSWHPHARIIVEPTLGLTPARLRGISEASSPLLVFVDDDNVLQSDYLQLAGEIASNWPPLGAWGGQALPQFERQPEPWAVSHLARLALREVDRDKWSNLPDCWETIPNGAGMCVRRDVAVSFADMASGDSRRIGLGRKGTSLVSAEDMDLALTAMDLGYGCGVFKGLILTHIIPAGRLTEEYLLRLTESQEFSGLMLQALRGHPMRVPQPTLPGRLLEWYRQRRLPACQRRFLHAKLRGRRRAYLELGLLPAKASIKP